MTTPAEQIKLVAPEKGKKTIIYIMEDKSIVIRHERGMYPSLAKKAASIVIVGSDGVIAIDDDDHASTLV